MARYEANLYGDLPGDFNVSPVEFENNEPKAFFLELHNNFEFGSLDCHDMSRWIDNRHQDEGILFGKGSM